jgi:hypothetical protein
LRTSQVDFSLVCHVSDYVLRRYEYEKGKKERPVVLTSREEAFEAKFRGISARLRGGFASEAPLFLSNLASTGEIEFTESLPTLLRIGVALLAEVMLA